MSQISLEKYRRMEAALRNILEISKDEFARSQAKYGLGIEKNDIPKDDGGNV
ncbi:hypothetical protein ACFCP7_10580 [Paenibacillus elgii]